jgi:hypothetical protein
MGVMVFVFACSENTTPTAVQSAQLREGIVARVGEDAISVATVRAVATAQALTPAAALNEAVVDALFAQGARQDLPPYESRSADRRSLARQLLADLHAQSRSRPVQTEELDEATKFNWTYLDRPVGYRSYHVVAMVKKEDDKAKRAKALAYAEKVREALLPVVQFARDTPAPERTDAQRFRVGSRPYDPVDTRFEVAVETVEKGELEVTAQDVGVLAADGSVIEHGVARYPGAYDAAYVKGVVDLADSGRGALTEVVESQFGYHVIMLLEITTAKKLSRDERLAWLKERRIISVQRSRDAYATILQGVRKTVMVDVAVNAPALMGSLTIGSPAAAAP